MMPARAENERGDRQEKNGKVVITDHYFEDVIDISDRVIYIEEVGVKTWRVNGHEISLGYIKEYRWN